MGLGGKNEEKRKKGEGERKRKREGERKKGDLEVDLFRAPKHSIILLKSKNFLCKGGSPPPAPPRRSKLLRSLRGHQKPVKYTCF